MNQNPAQPPVSADTPAGTGYQPPSSGHPEIKTGSVAGETSPETAEIREIPGSPEIEPELQEHIQKVQSGEIELPGPIEVGRHRGKKITIGPSAPQTPNIILPVTEDELQAGEKKPASSAFRWLVEFVKLIIKKNPARTLYKHS